MFMYSIIAESISIIATAWIYRLHTTVLIVAGFKASLSNKAKKLELARWLR